MIPAEKPSVRGKSKCKGPKVGTCLACLKNSKGASVAIPEGMESSERDEVRELKGCYGVVRKIMARVLQGSEDFGFCPEWDGKEATASLLFLFSP